MNRLVLDLDCGLGIHGADIDDGLEALMALGSDRVELAGIGVAAGNVDIESAYRCTCALLQSMGVDAIPVGKGCGRPLGRGLPTGKELLQRRIELLGGEYPPGEDLVNSVEQPHYEAKDAVDLLIDAVRSAPGEITLVATAPLTNVATAMQTDESLAGNLKDVVLMGGLHRVAGNVTPETEFNIASDPDAAEIVIKSGVHITMVPLDVTMGTLLTMEDWGRIAQGNVWLSEYSIKATASWLDFLGRALGLPGCPLHDLLALAIALESTVARTEPAQVSVVTGDGLGAGKTVFDFEKTQADGSEIDVVVEHDNKMFMELVRDCLHG
jgi:purine nucleosidase